jgi:hypothetical protein
VLLAVGRPDDAPTWPTLLKAQGGIWGVKKGGCKLLPIDENERRFLAKATVKVAPYFGLHAIFSEWLSTFF